MAAKREKAKSASKSTGKAAAKPGGAAETARPNGDGSHGAKGLIAERPVNVTVAHEIPGRLRLRVKDALDRAGYERLVDRVAATALASRVVARPNTGSLIVEGRPPGEPLLTQLQSRGVLAVTATPAQSAPPIDQLAQLGMARLDHEIGSRTSGALNFHSALAVALMLGAAYQASRGRIAGPATTLFISALSLIDKSRR